MHLLERVSISSPGVVPDTARTGEPFNLGVRVRRSQSLDFGKFRYLATPCRLRIYWSEMIPDPSMIALTMPQTPSPHPEQVCVNASGPNSPLLQ
jgi:hypothetical protein